MSGRELLVLATTVSCSLAIMGWVVWSERPAPPPANPLTSEASANGTGSAALDETHVAALQAAAKDAPEDVSSRLALGDLYFGAERWEEAVRWYEQAHTLSPESFDVSTNLGISYYYAGQTQQAIDQFERTLEADPMDPRALLSLGIVRAFGLQDREGAMELWERVIEITPDSPEGLAAREAMDRMRSAHGTSEGDASTVR